MHPKVKWSALTGAGVTLLVLSAHQFFNYTISAEWATAATTFLSLATGWLVPGGADDA